MTRQDFKALKRGDLVRHKHENRTFVVTANYGDRVTAVSSVDLTNPPEWDQVDPVGARSESFPA